MMEVVPRSKQHQQLLWASIEHTWGPAQGRQQPPRHARSHRAHNKGELLMAPLHEICVENVANHSTYCQERENHYVGFSILEIPLESTPSTQLINNRLLHLRNKDKPTFSRIQIAGQHSNPWFSASPLLIPLRR
ncbi:hypothetical protein NE237_009800 [Protea cynaroides]|uniref:Uncharacterized protein n=1 Tax=Protea cynaroides TaxID=273540 RepID=A0A9Q0R131_9MAGN|nr:hypothetical protein NE237_009800 [Protea cynaroides]